MAIFELMIYTVTIGNAHASVACSLDITEDYLDRLAAGGIQRIWVNNQGAIYAYQLCGSEDIQLAGELATAETYELPEHLQNLIYPCPTTLDRILDRIFYYGTHNLTQLNHNRLRAIRYADTVLADPTLPRFIRIDVAMTPQCDLATICKILSLDELTAYILERFKLESIKYMWIDRHGHPYAYQLPGQIGVCLMGTLDEAQEWSSERSHQPSQQDVDAILDRIILHGMTAMTASDLRILRAY
jgi:hypothetical protein